ncbi:MAG: hypothetical protein K8F52_06130 [Candidatus Scalindua rubra]|uniref:Uncharacterized protein n=1 Tax=Candidatus Scalindua brodae TaxID=237368 RepID=A0A0B0ESN1_9BACT|nr:MAG: hypothetical protein SCABRO_00551 [Candidatus Scalindua brodae]MBZ0108228.1 hypothetical protein [Candidatus Scalindua rubra]TWU33492.1 hypothetical protein S225a_13790 [Candidatus Brocadiaceae bacterium S225]
MKILNLLKSFYSEIDGTKKAIFHSAIAKENKILIKFLLQSGLVESLRIEKKKGYIPVFTKEEMNKLEFINITDLRTISMVTKNERKYQTVIHAGILKDWVGFGWAELGKPTKEDFEKYPIALL